MEFLYTFHSHFRWLVLVAAALAFLKLVLTWMSKANYSKADSILMGFFTWMITIQALLGLILLFWLGGETGYPMHRIEHATTMLIALGLVHFSARWKSYPGPARARNTAVVILVALVLIAVGISRLPQGWTPTVLP